MHVGLLPVNLRAVQMGIDKGKGISHLYKGHRPVPLTSPVPRVQSRVAQRKLASTLELTGRYTHAVFLYRREVRPAFMALALRAVQTHPLLTLRQFATVDCDESDAYLHPQREDQSRLNGLMRPMWDFGPWAASYFSRICIYALTEDGFTDGFVPEVGFNRDDNVSGEAYQPGSIVVSSTLSVFPEVYIPFRGERLPVNNLMFSDDRRLCAPSLAEAILLVDECVYGTRSKAGTEHPGKLQFYSWTLEGDTMVQRSAEVPDYQTVTNTEPRSVVGIPVTHHAYPWARIREIEQVASRLHARVQAETICVMLAQRA